MYALKRAVRGAIDPESELGRAVAEWRSAIVADLGGEERLSRAQLSLVDLAVRDWLILESVDGWLLEQPRLVNGRRKSLFPVVVERTRLADGLTRRLQALGLERKPRPVPSLAEYIASKAAEREDRANGSEPASECQSEGQD